MQLNQQLFKFSQNDLCQIFFKIIYIFLFKSLRLFQNVEDYYSSDITKYSLEN